MICRSCRNACCSAWVHGGAVPFERRDHEPMVDAREMLNAEEKLRIGREATLQVPERGSIIIDSGSTSQRFAEVFRAIVRCT